jgi:hypothetical protein
MGHEPTLRSNCKSTMARACKGFDQMNRHNFSVLLHVAVLFVCITERFEKHIRTATKHLKLQENPQTNHVV